MRLLDETSPELTCRHWPTSRIGCADVGFPSLHVASLCNCCCRPVAVLFLRVGNRLSHTCIACYFSQRYVPRLPCSVFGSRQSAPLSHHSSVCCVATSSLIVSFVNSSLLLFWHFFDLSNSGVLSIFHSFSRRWYATIFRIEGAGATDKDGPRRYWGYYTSSIHYAFTIYALILISSWLGNRHKI